MFFLKLLGNAKKARQDKHGGITLGKDCQGLLEAIKQPGLSGKEGVLRVGTQPTQGKGSRKNMSSWGKLRLKRQRD